MLLWIVRYNMSFMNMHSWRLRWICLCSESTRSTVQICWACLSFTLGSWWPMSERFGETVLIWFQILYIYPDLVDIISLTFLANVLPGSADHSRKYAFTSLAKNHQTQIHDIMEVPTRLDKDQAEGLRSNQRPAMRYNRYILYSGK